MRFFSTILSLFAILVASAAFAAQNVTVSVPDMECESCSQTLIKNFEKNPAIAHVRADLDTRVLTLTLKEGAKLEKASIQAIVRESGFTPDAVHANAEHAPKHPGKPSAH